LQQQPFFLGAAFFFGVAFFAFFAMLPPYILYFTAKLSIKQIEETWRSDVKSESTL